MGGLHLPVSADDIQVEWVTTEVGISATAFTDDDGVGFIGLCPLNRMGSPNGLPCWFRRTHLKDNIVIGYRDRKPIVVLVDVEASKHGLSLSVVVLLDNGCQYESHSFSEWGSERPRYGFTVGPANSNWPVNPFPKEAHYDCENSKRSGTNGPAVGKL